MPKVAEVVNSFKSEQVQLLAFRKLLSNYGLEIIEDPDSSSADPDLKKKGTTKKKKAKRAKKKTGNIKKTKSTSLSIIKDLNLKPRNKKTIDAFIADKQPSSLLEKTATCVYYLGHTLSIKGICYNHVFTCFKHLKWRLPADLPNMMQQAGTKGWLDTSSNDDIKITTHGENLIEHDLPKTKKG
jgi:hypothetical protein